MNYQFVQRFPTIVYVVFLYFDGFVTMSRLNLARQIRGLQGSQIQDMEKFRIQIYFLIFSYLP